MKTDAVSIDLESHLIQPGLPKPPIVCGSMGETSGTKMSGALLSVDQSRAVWNALLTDPKYTICGANISYDVGVFAVDAARRGIDLMPAIFNAYDPDRTIIRGRCNGRIFDVQIAEALHAIAQGHLGKEPRTGRPMTNPETGRKGRYSLRAVVDQALGRDDAKVNDRFRMSYALLEGTPIEQWPSEARTYPVDDAINTLEAALAQAGHRSSRNNHEWIPHDVGTMICTGCRRIMSPEVSQDCMILRRRRNLNDLSRQVYAALALDFGATWGFKVNQTAVDALELKYSKDRVEDAKPFVAAGIIRDDETENQSVLKRLVALAYGSTEGGCLTCLGGGKVPSVKTEGRTKINCPDCDGTGMLLSDATPRSPKDGIAKGRDQLAESGNELLMDYGDFGEGKKILTTYIPMLRGGRACNVCGKTGAGKHPHEEGCPAGNGEAGYREIPLTLRVNPIVETGRTAVEGGMHGMPRKGGVRECIESRPGWVFSSEDYSAGELVTLSQVCIWMVGYSKLGEALNLGLDAHLALAGTMTGRDYQAMLLLKKAGDKLAIDSRQAAKAANFGFGGGMAELTFVLRKRADPDCFTPCIYGPAEQNGVRGYKGLRTCILMDGAERCGEEMITKYKDKHCSPVCRKCVASAKRLQEFWFRQWPEMNKKDGYFYHVGQQSKIVGPSGSCEISQFQSNRIRGGVDYCSLANGYFQGLLAEASKNALCQVVRECFDNTCRVENSEHMTSLYAGGPSPLLGSRFILLPHDEIIPEHPESVAHEAATRVGECMTEALRFMCPQMAPAVKAEATLMRKLYKSSEPQWRDGGNSSAGPNDRLIPWEPKKKAAA